MESIITILVVARIIAFQVPCFIRLKRDSMYALAVFRIVGGE